MNDVTRLLNALEQGDPHAASRLLPLGYEELLMAVLWDKYSILQKGADLEPSHA
jgi:hypothetical protein